MTAARRAFALAASTLLLAGAACTRSPTQIAQTPPAVELTPKEGDDPPIVIAIHEYKAALARARLDRSDQAGSAPLPPDLKSAVLNDLMKRRVLLRRAHQLGISVPKESVDAELARIQNGLGAREMGRRMVDTIQTQAEFRSLIEERLTVGALVKQEVHDKISVSDEEIEAEWKKRPAEEKIGKAKFHASQIVVRTEQEANIVLGKLTQRRRRRRKNAPPPPTFAEIAKEHSIGPEAARGGDLGWVEVGSMPHVFDEAILPLAPGRMSGIVTSDYGFHIFKLHNKEAEHRLKLPEVRERLRVELLEAKIENAEREYVKGLLDSFEIVKNEEAINAMD